MDEVRTFLFNKVSDRDDLNDTILAYYLQLSTKQVGNLRTGKRKLTLRHILVLSQLVDPENHRNFMRSVCPKLTESSDCIRKTFEYAAITRDIDLLDTHIANYKNEKRNIIEKYVKVYSFISDYMNGKIPFTSMEEELEKLSNLNDPILKILVDIYLCINLLQKRQFSYVINKASEIEKQINALNDKSHLFLKECYLYRVSEVLAYAHLFSNDLIEARRYSNILLNANINKRVNSDALYILGMSYLLNDEHKSLYYLTESVKKAKEINEPRLMWYAVYNYNFARILLGKKVEEDAPDVLKTFEAFLNGKTSYEKAKFCIDEVDDPDLTGYFESVLGTDRKNIYKKFCDFVSDSNLFYASIIVRDLMKLGECTDFIENLTINLRGTSAKKGDVVFEENFINCFNIGERYCSRVAV
ncbi:AimR family lysis-lysogeny pheromone receptor [Bacillus velezensis]|uniref:AimR family lysis-lysogeny pheromone receptor n=1 Tax=Bacillus velezensis TaxID=492670 RepID=UPI001F0DDC36|nr:AimR family lysis-lysogeny pheromone receptor [Bacillus velezensis]UMQ50217.1 AimR family lysis-lysogeny pheromone receptor [Bacillus velezensis]